jgi:endonuclease/exonuclease/phosphatase family metal-dependent hydrolase
MNLSILTWNIACLPRKLNFFRNPIKQIDNIIRQINNLNCDIICLQEVFDFDIQKKIIYNFENNNYNYYIHETENNIISQNGLIIASKYNLSNNNYLDYSNFTGPECFIKKGLISSTINTTNNDIIIHNTHMQSDSMGDKMINYCSKIRHKQHLEIIKYLNNTNTNTNDINILCGDINDDYDYYKLKSFIDNLPYKYNDYNINKLITFPKYDEQLDYIITNYNNNNINITHNYNVIDCYNSELSDHNILVNNLNIN